jgi:hypothetical protein
MTAIGFAALLARLVASLLDLIEHATSEGLLDEMQAQEMLVAAAKLAKFGPPVKKDQ